MPTPKLAGGEVDATAVADLTVKRAKNATGGGKARRGGGNKPEVEAESVEVCCHLDLPLFCVSLIHDSIAWPNP